jgi:hypothetical protein
MIVASSGGDDVAVYWCPQIPPPPNEARPDTDLLRNLQVLCPPSLSDRSWNYLLANLGTSFFGTAISQDLGCRHLLVYINDFLGLAVVSTSTGFLKAFYDPSLATPED